MCRKWVFLVAAAVVLVASPGLWAGEHTGGADKTFRDSLSRGPVGRFQAVTVDDSSVVILDTQEGRIWMWDLSGLGTVSMVYGGQVFLGENMGEMIQSIPVKPKEK
jgi:hypothetical protein